MAQTATLRLMVAGGFILGFALFVAGPVVALLDGQAWIWLTAVGGVLMSVARVVGRKYKLAAP